METPGKRRSWKLSPKKAKEAAEQRQMTIREREQREDAQLRRIAIQRAVEMIGGLLPWSWESDCVAALIHRVSFHARESRPAVELSLGTEVR